MQKIENYINGELVAPIGGTYLDNFEPATGRVYAQVPDCDECDVQAAVEAASDAFGEWSRMPVAERSNVMLPGLPSLSRFSSAPHNQSPQLNVRLSSPEHRLPDSEFSHGLS